MLRRVSRPIALVMLVAFLSANSYGLGHARLARSGADRCHDVANGPACDHCSAHQNPLSAAEPTPTGEPSPATPCPDDDAPSYPCQCPGGCPMCNVAKVLSLPAQAPLPEVAACQDDGIDEAPPLYESPFRGTLTPPPRA
jgi:hypothetical protein